MIPRDKLLKIKGKLISNLILLGEYDKALGPRKKVLLVEGSTDKAFIEPIKAPSARCLSVSDFMRAQAAFSAGDQQQDFNSKDVIIELIKHLQGIPMYLEFPREANTWPVFGLVDNDLQTDKDYMRYSKLFFTGTHDIETFMLSTDGDILTRLNGCVVSREDAKKAFYIAYQLAFFRQAIRESGFVSRLKCEEPDGTTQFSLFTDGSQINLPRLMEYIQMKSDGKTSKAKIDKFLPRIRMDLKKKLDSTGYWKETLDQFEITADSEFWHEVNGHDICSAIRFVNISAQYAFGDSQGYRRNRSFEFALSKAYDYEAGRDTALFDHLHNAGVIILG